MRRTCDPRSTRSPWLIQMASIQTARLVARPRQPRRNSARFSRTWIVTPLTIMGELGSGEPQTYEPATYFLADEVTEVVTNSHCTGACVLRLGKTRRSRKLAPSEGKGS